ncbi:MAG: molecular chaperone GrpE [Actinomycetota bacterium]|nr:molecular chaperone GrpE [Actinomycetota bacterium]
MNNEPVIDDGRDTRETTATSDTDEPDQRLLRALADLDNLRKRYERELIRERSTERARVAAQWLPVVDDLERALEYAGSNGDPLIAGVRAVHDHALAVLEQLGFPRFEDIGAPFDPTRHEAVGAVESTAPAGSVAVASRPGYGTNENMLRPASVLVARRVDSG